MYLSVHHLKLINASYLALPSALQDSKTCSKQTPIDPHKCPLNTELLTLFVTNNSVQEKGVVTNLLQKQGVVNGHKFLLNLTGLSVLIFLAVMCFS